MIYRHLGSSGLQISALSFGSWITFHNQAGVREAVEMMAVAHDAGVNFFDNAEAYAGGRSEEVMGAALKKLGWRRGSYLVSTKLYWGVEDGVNERNTLNRKYLLEAIGPCLQRLGLDHVDLLYCHRDDPATPVGEVVWAMNDIISRGQALYWGTSEWEAQRILEALDFAEAHHLRAPVVEQPVYNLLERHRFGQDYDPVYQRGYGATTWSPLASGLLSGKYRDGIPADSRGALPNMQWMREQFTDARALVKVNTLQPLAEEIGASLAQFAIAWCLQNPKVSSVITGASRVEQLYENLDALEFVDTFTPGLLSRIDQVLSHTG